MTKPCEAAFADLKEACRHLAISARGVEMIEDVGSDEEGFRRLAQAGLYSEATTLLANRMPFDLAIWWALLATWESTGGQPNVEEDAVLSSALLWLRSPTPPARNLCREAHEHLGAHSAAGCLAGAVARAGVIDPEDDSWKDAQPRDVASSVVYALSYVDATMQRHQRTESKRELFELGLDVSEGRLPWTDGSTVQPSSERQA